ncbi:MAG: SdrD B-like domain-containing protein, partial [Acidimicrobiales bacterium]
RVSAAGSTVTGRVYQDFASNGTYDTTVATGQAADIGVAGIAVAAYDSTGAKVGTATSGSDGTYSVTVSGNTGTDLRIEFEIPSTSPLSAFRNSFAGTNSGTSVQFVSLGATSVDYAISVPGEYCQNNPNLSISRLCAGATASVNTSASAWVTRFDGGPYTTAQGFSDRYADWSATKVATKADTGSILGMTWDPGTRRIFHAAYVRRHAELYESGGQPVPAAIFVTTPTGTTAATGTGGSTSFLVDLETLMAGDQFSNSNSAGPGYIPTNAAREILYMPNGAADGGADNDGVDSDLVAGQDGVFEEVGKAGIGDIETDGNGKLWVVSLYDKKLYQVVLPSSGAPTTMTSLGDISSGVSCTNGQARPFSVRLWRGGLYLGVVCDGADDFNPATPAVLNNANVTFTVRRYDLSAGTWSTAFGPQNLSSAGGVVKGNSDTAFALNTRDNWNPWTDTFSTSSQTRYLTRPTPILSEIEFDRDGSMILGFRDRNGDQQGTNDSEDPEGGNTAFPTLASGDIYRVCRTGTGYASSDYVFEGGTGCAQRTNANYGTEYYAGDFWFDRTQRGHAEISAGLIEQVPGFPDVIMNSYDPYDGDSSGKAFYSGGPRWLRNSTGEPSAAPNSGSGVMFYNWDGEAGNPNTIGGFLKTNGMSDIEALCDQAPVQIGNRVWIDTDKDGIQDPGETPVAGVTVRVYAANGTTLLGTAVTNAKGEYYFSSNVTEAAAGNGDNSGGGITVGATYVIRLDNPADYAAGGPLDGYTLTGTTQTDSVTSLDTFVDSNAATVSSYPQMTTASLLAGTNDHTYDVGFYRSAPVGMGNYVWIDADKDGIQDSSEKPISGVVVTLYNPDGTTAKNLAGGAATATTDATGYYFIDNLAAGSYYAKFTLPAAYQFTTKSSAGSSSANDSNPDATTGITPVFTIGPSASGDTVADTDTKTTATFVNPTIDAGVVPKGTVSVGNLVWRDLNGDGIQGPADSGVKGAVLRLYNADGTPVVDAFGRPVRAQTTGKDGKFLFRNLLPGKYVVKISYPKGWLATTNERSGREKNSSAFRATSRTLSAGQSDTSLDFGMVRNKRGLLPATR